MLEINIDDCFDGVPFVKAATNMRLMVPRLIVIHYTVTRTAKGAIAAFSLPGANASAHLVVDRDGSMTQMVPFDRTAAHAGKSSWKGVEGCNRYSIGIEVVNMGPLKLGGDGILRDVYGKPMPEGTPTVSAKAPGGSLWEAYPEPQFLAVAEACKALCARYNITEIVGHSDVSPGRKIDPGPAMDMAALRKFAL